MTKTLVVFYSRSGHTEQLALRLAELIGADTERIRDNTARGGWLGYQRCAIEAFLGHTPKIRPCRYRPQDYDLVIIGTPVWVWNMSSPVRSYVDHYRGKLTRVAVFCTCGGSGDNKVLDDLERLLGRPALARLSVKEHQIEKSREPLAFVHKLKRLEAIRTAKCLTNPGALAPAAPGAVFADHRAPG